MRLYEVLVVPSDPAKKLHLIQTDETFTSADKFRIHVQVNGEKYEGKSWMLISEKNQPKVMTIKPKPQYEVEFEG